MIFSVWQAVFRTGAAATGKRAPLTKWQNFVHFWGILVSKPDPNGNIRGTQQAHDGLFSVLFRAKY
jgi:hypothetical protein